MFWLSFTIEGLSLCGIEIKVLKTLQVTLYIQSLQSWCYFIPLISALFCIVCTCGFEGTGLGSIAWWEYGFESRPKAWLSISCECYVLFGTAVCLLWVLYALRYSSLSLVSVVCCPVQLSVPCECCVLSSTALYLLWVLYALRYSSLSLVSVVCCPVQLSVTCECCVLSGTALCLLWVMYALLYSSLSLVSVVCCPVHFFVSG